jgi:GT2 family glycosyltransferase
MPEVLIAIPNSGELSASCVSSLAGRQPMLFPASVNSLCERRNEAAKALLDSSAEWLLFVDSDMGWAPDAIDRLVEAADPVERPIMGGLCFGLQQRDPDGMGGFDMKPFPTIFDFDGQEFKIRWDYQRDSVVRVDATGCAFLLIHRDVLAKMRSECGDTWFDRARLGDELLGEDLSFCARVGELGFPVHVHTGVRTSHYKSLWLTEAHYIAARLAAAATSQRLQHTAGPSRVGDCSRSVRLVR